MWKIIKIIIIAKNINTLNFKIIITIKVNIIKIMLINKNNAILIKIN